MLRDADYSFVGWISSILRRCIHRQESDGSSDPELMKARNEGTCEVWEKLPEDWNPEREATSNPEAEVVEVETIGSGKLEKFRVIRTH